MGYVMDFKKVLKDEKEIIDVEIGIFFFKKMIPEKNKNHHSHNDNQFRTGIQSMHP